MFEVTYASVVINRPGHTVTGCVLVAEDESQFEAKLAHYDQIEGYNAIDPPSGLYERTVQTAHLQDGKTIQCFMYHRTNIDVNTATQIPSGDWLKREKKE